MVYHSHADKRRRRGSPRATISPHFSPARGPGPTLSQRSAWPLAPRLLPHTMSSHMLERLCPKEQIKSTPPPAPPPHLLPLFSPSFCTLHKRSMRLRTYPGIFRRVLIAPLGEGGGGGGRTSRTSSSVHSALTLLWISLKSCVCKPPPPPAHNPTPPSAVSFPANQTP